MNDLRDFPTTAIWSSVALGVISEFVPHSALPFLVTAGGLVVAWLTLRSVSDGGAFRF